MPSWDIIVNELCLKNDQQITKKQTIEACMFSDYTWLFHTFYG